DANEMDGGQRQPDGDGRRRCVGRRRGHPQDDEDENGRQNDLDGQGAADADADHRQAAIAVRAEAGDRPAVEGGGAERSPQHQRADDPARELGDPVAARLGQPDAAGQPDPAVTAGLTWLPDTGPMKYTSVSSVRPNASAVATTPAATLVPANLKPNISVATPQATYTNIAVPRNSTASFRNMRLSLPSVMA